MAIPGLARMWRLRRSLAFVWRSGPGWTIANAVIIAIQAMLPLVLLYAIKLIFDFVVQVVGSNGGTREVSDGEFSHMLLLIGLAAGIGLLQSFLTAAGRWVGEAQAQAVTDYMYGVLHDKSLEVDLAYYENPLHRDTLHRAQRSAPFRPKRIVISLLEFLRNGSQLVVMSIVLAAFHWSVLPILILSSIPGTLLRIRYSSEYYAWEVRATLRERWAAYFNLLVTTDGFAKEIRLFGLGGMFRERFRKLREELRAEKLKVTRRRSVAEFVGEGLAVAGVFGVLAFMTHSALAGVITVGTVMAYYTALQRAWNHLGLMLHYVSDLYEDNLFIHDLFDFLEVDTQVKSPAQPKALPPPERMGIELDRVSFRYPHDERMVLRDVSLRLAPGEHVALVGHNGSGKTTLVKLVSRLYDPTGGALRLGGIDLRELDLAAYRRSIGVLMQDFCRYQMTLRENVWLGDIGKDVRDPAIDAAVAGADATAIVAGLPQGMESMLGVTFQGAHELSTGQWQKIALARMLARGAPILVLDEPTSAMDAEAEEELIRKFREIAVGRTTLLISHRLAAVKQLDRIVYLEKGIVAESGTHDELMRRGGGYARLFELQSKHYR
jgi:ATP-binding cassette subfamily B protein